MDQITPQPTETKPDTPESDPVMDAFRMELQRLFTGDKPLTARNLNLIIQTATAARDILALRNPRLRGRCRPGAINAMYGGYQGGMMSPMDPMDDEEAEAETVTGNGIPPLPPYPMPNPMGMDRETFGAKILRELVAVVPQVARSLREDPAQIVKAIAEARGAGLNDIAKELEARLRGETKVAVIEVPQSSKPTNSPTPVPVPSEVTP